MTPFLVPRADRETVPLTAVRKGEYERWRARQPAALRRWLDAIRFDPQPGAVALVPGADGALSRAVVGLSDEVGAAELWDWAHLPAKLPPRRFQIEEKLDGKRATRAALGWSLATYTFARYRRAASRFATLVWPAGCDRPFVERTAEATFLVRDLVNTPASDMGPAELAAAARALARRHKARFASVVGPALLARNFPAIHAVGRASSRAPRLIDLRWGTRGPRVTLVGKGVCFDTGGLDLKSSANMKLMKKDMGGAAHALGVAAIVMAAKLPVRLRVLIPAVENSVSGDAMRPLDVVATRKGTTVEIGNTDAEGRVILADALWEASSESPDLILDFATLTGAARVALGTELPALFCNDDRLADLLLGEGTAAADPLWRMPLWKGYRADVDGQVADLTNAPEGGYGGAITAALFLQEFVGRGIPWAHIDLMAWNLRARPGRPQGGEAMGMRAVASAIAAWAGRRRPG